MSGYLSLDGISASAHTIAAFAGTPVTIKPAVTDGTHTLTLTRVPARSTLKTGTAAESFKLDAPGVFAALFHNASQVRALEWVVFPRRFSESNDEHAPVTQEQIQAIVDSHRDAVVLNSPRTIEADTLRDLLGEGTGIPNLPSHNWN